MFPNYIPRLLIRTSMDTFWCWLDFCCISFLWLVVHLIWIPQPHGEVARAGANLPDSWTLFSPFSPYSMKFNVRHWGYHWRLGAHQATYVAQKFHLCHQGFHSWQLKGQKQMKGRGLITLPGWPYHRRTVGDDCLSVICVRLRSGQELDRIIRTRIIIARYAVLRTEVRCSCKRKSCQWLPLIGGE